MKEDLPYPKERLRLPVILSPGAALHPDGGEVESAGECLSLGPSPIHGGRHDAG